MSWDELKYYLETIKYGFSYLLSYLKKLDVEQIVPRGTILVEQTKS